MPLGTRYAHPVFAIVRADGRHFGWLAQRIGYSHSHVRNVASGQFPASPRFRAACAALLGMPERDLFHDASSASPSEGSDDSSDRAGIAVTPESYPIDEEVSLEKSA